MVKSGAQKFWEKLKALFALKSENVYGDDNTDNTDYTYQPGLVPTCGKKGIPESMFLRHDGKWAKPFAVDAGSFTGHMGNQTISSDIKGKKYIEVFDSEGAMVMAAKIGTRGTYDVTSIYSRIGSITSADASSVTITMGNGSGNGTYHWVLFGTP